MKKRSTIIVLGILFDLFSCNGREQPEAAKQEGADTSPPTALYTESNKQFCPLPHSVSQ
ncbi:hypothetical protein [Hymenobacter sp.]|uniref:hypothetical protein n=1 Tax=Hymenobacter sp. TaxID=1898978 RepID=UPI00286C5110|nr:hypothetical protein [Hymenobacter sp.]